MALQSFWQYRGEQSFQLFTDEGAAENGVNIMPQQNPTDAKGRLRGKHS